MFCKYCGKELPDNAIFCSKCGKQLAKESAKIPEVKNTPPEVKNPQPEVNDVPSATHVTNSLPKNQYTHYMPTESSKSRLAAALLAFFLGEFGAHRFYVGKTGSGFAQLILGLSFFIALICAAFDGIELAAVFVIVGIAWIFWVFIDFVIILCGSFKDKDGLSLTDWGL